MDLSRRHMLFGISGVAVAGGGSSLIGRDLFKSLIGPAPTAGVAPQPGGLPPMQAANPTPAPMASQPFTGEIKRVALHNLHTGDKLDTVFYENGQYVPDAMDEAMRVLRDWRNGEEHAMDPRLFDVLHAVSEKLETRAPFQIISGYRSPQSNAVMHERSSQVASHSQHMLGKASDIRVDGVDLRYLHRAATSLKAGGVGYYPDSNFVHVDVGPVRTWQGS
ncbi:MAG: DUF882 domain-containing protein [Acetobacteraceae bacterium]|nr:DUF882 domain-containing protein [Acetobacteraceae bacterium]